MTDIFTKEKRSEIMSKIRGKWTKPEWEYYELHPEAIPHPDWLPHHPDFLLNGVPIFVDTGFWHGYVKAEKYAGYSEWWQKKLLRNITRDTVRDGVYNVLSEFAEAPSEFIMWE